MAAKTKAQDIIDNNAVGEQKTPKRTNIPRSRCRSRRWRLTDGGTLTAVFSKSYCPYCKATKSLLSEMGAKAYIIELDQVDDGAAIQDALEEMTHQRSVPNIFIAKKHIGGNSDLQGKKSQLPKMLQEAHAI
ncbi:Glutaredoxin [Friedmanniomyces endolithicus]|nr:Glutaredoxin [Friedmanniomyces endolithicus]